MGSVAKVFKISNWTAGPFFILDLVYIAILVVILIGRHAHWLAINKIPDPIGGLVPIAIPWFGALGAVTLSLYGVFTWNDQWKTKWNYWHAARPFVGAIFAVVSFLIFVGIINATGASANVKSAPATDNLPYLVLAFIVGFREQTFRTLLQRAVDIILGPGIPDQTPASIQVTAKPRVAPHTGNPENVEVTVTNSGGADVTISQVQTQVTPVNAATIGTIAGLQGSIVSPMSHVTAQIPIQPNSNVPFTVNVTVSGTFATSSVTIERT
jgi:hypothetical protein